MKSRVNLTVDELLMDQVKRYAILHQTSVSQLVENFFIQLTRTPARKNVIDLINKMPPPTFDSALDATDLKDKYYSDQKGKYGF